jgi:hypothetical protein
VFRWITGVAVGAALLVLVAGCGSGDDSTTEVTKAEFTKQANAICAGARKEREAASSTYAKEVAAKSNGEPTVKLQRDLAERMVDEKFLPSLENELRGLEELDAPAADEAEISKMLRTFSTEMGAVEKGGVRAILVGGGFSNFEKEAESYGLSCAVF